jgi:carboxypeptidase Q
MTATPKLSLALLSALLLASASAHAQEPVDRTMIAKIRAEGLERSQVGPMFDTLANIFGPRLTATPAYLASANWARGKLASWRLEKPRLEAWPFGRGWTLERQTIEMTAPRYMPLIGYAEAWSPSTKGELNGTPIMTAGKSVEELQQMQASLAGAIVMSQPIVTSFIREDREQPSEPSRALAAATPAAPPANPAAPTAGRGGQGGRGGRGGGGPTPASVLNAAGPGVILKPNRGEHGTLFVLGATGRGSGPPSMVLSAEHYNLVARLLEHGQPVKLRVNIEARYHTADTSGYNVIAEIPGTDLALRDQVVMLGGHLDSWHSATGATDNADGAAVVLEAARILQTVGARPRRTIRFALWGGEEEGLIGSARWVDANLAGDANAAARAKMSLYLNIDPGKGPIYGFYMQGNDAAQPIFDAWLEPFKDLRARRNIPSSIGNTDHLSFTRVGVPGFNPIQDYVGYDVREHHTNMDTYERVAIDDLKQNAVILASFLYHAAMRNEMMPRPPVR